MVASRGIQDIRFAAFLRVKKVPILETTNDPRGRYCTYHFELTDEEYKKYWRAYQNPCEERMVDAYELLEAYENLKTQRIKSRS